MRWPLLAPLALLASPAAARADGPPRACTRPAADAKLTIPFTPDLSLHDLGALIAGVTCKSVVYDGEAAARAPRLALIAPSELTLRQAVQLFAETVQKAGLAVAERADTFVISLDPATRRPCARPGATRAPAAPAACARPGAAKIAVSFKPDATLDDLAIWASSLTCKRVSFDPAVATQGTRVGVIASAPLSARQAARLFIDALEATGLTVIERADAYDVKPGPRWAHCAAPAPAAPPPGGAGPAPQPPAPAVDLDAVLDAGIRKLDDTHYEVKQSVLDQIDATPMAFAGGARIVPAVKNGQPDGFKLFSVRPSSLFARVGLVNGDTLQTFNGRSLTSPDQALEAYASLRTARRAVIGLVRRGAPVTLTITIVK